MPVKTSRDYIQYNFPGPHMNRGAAYTKIMPGSCGRVVGADCRYGEGIRKFYGMKLLVDLDGESGLGDIDAYSGPSFMQAVTFQKRGTVTTYRGFVIRWDAIDSLTDQQVDLVYTDDNGATWARENIWATGSGITSTVAMQCAETGDFLMIAIEGQSCKTVYWDTSGTPALTVVDSGAGAFTTSLPEITYAPGSAPVAVASDDGYYLRLGGTYQFAYRFYSSTRNVYSAMSTIHTTVEDANSYSKYHIEFPDSSASFTYTDSGAGFADLFDTLQVFRSVNIAGSTSAGALLYLDTELTQAGVTTPDLSDDSNPWTDVDKWIALTLDVGRIPDEALFFQETYNPETDIMKAVPESGAIGRYQGITLIAQAATDEGGFNTLHSAADQLSPEYFNSYNEYQADTMDGVPLNYVNGADSCYIMATSSIVQVNKKSDTQPLKFTKMHLRRGIVAKEAAHSVGNSIVMLSGLGFMLLDGTRGNAAQITAADRVVFGDWASDLAKVKSAYDARMNTSYFLNPDDDEILQIGHSTQSVSMLEGANFVTVSSTIDIVDEDMQRAYFITETGLIVYPDANTAGSGTMWALDDDGAGEYTFNGATTNVGTDNVIDTGATFSDDMIGALVYMTSGDNAGESRVIESFKGTTMVLVTAFDNQIAIGDTYAVSPVPFKVRMWPLRDNDPRVAVYRFKRWNMTSITLEVIDQSGFTNLSNNKFRLSGYRNGSSNLSNSSSYVAADTNPADMSESINIDGIVVEPYIEQISVGTGFELTRAEVGVTITESRNAAD